MKRITQGIFLGLLTNFCAPSLFADEFPIVSGRVSPECPVIELKLTDHQTQLVETKYTSGMTIKLSASQIHTLKAKTKRKISPTKIRIYKAVELAGSCTCALNNFALPFKPGWVEIPIGYLCSDREAKLREIID